MPPPKPQTSFLLRGTGLLICLLALWWFFLLPPMLYALRGMAGMFLHVEALPSGDWTFRVPLERVLPATPERPAQQLHSIDFDMPRTDVIAFTFSLPVYWAILLAAPGLRRNLRTLAVGTALMAAVELVLLLILAHIVAQKAAWRLAGGEVGDVKWIWRAGEYLVVSVIPYLAPFVLALSLHRELREQILGGGSVETSPVRTPDAGQAGRRAKKRR